MDQKRPIVFMLISTAIILLWMGFVVPRFFPQPVRPDAKPADVAQAQDQPALAELPDDPPADRAAAVSKGAKPEAEPAAGPPKFPHDSDVILGSLDPESGYFLQVELTTRGAAIEAARLNDARYRDLEKPKEQLRLLDEVPVPAGELADGPAQYRTLQTASAAFDRQLEPFHTSLEELDWQIDPDAPRTASEVTFRMPSADGTLEFIKRYTLTKPERPEGVDPAEFRDTNAAGYQLGVELTVRNLSDEPKTVAYTLQGPVGVPLENGKNTRKFRDLRVGFLQPSGSVKSSTTTPSEIIKQKTNDKIETWTSPLRYGGVDMQFFAVLLSPGGNPLEDPYLEQSQPQLLRKNPNEESHSDVSLLLTSKPLELGPDDSVTHTWTLFAGPKREPLLAPMGAEEIVDFGFASVVSRVMLSILNFFHGMALPYGIAIVCLTVLVRACMFPISRKQAISAKKMKDLQPKIAELKKKYADDKEKFGRAQLELFGKYGYNPLAGCLPMLFQLPIFIGLYNALNTAVDLRMAQFLYIDNLAAPDALFRLPFDLPFLGTNEFNLLPILTVVLFIVQQKLFTPPPMDEQQAATMKMMPWLMGFMGLMFYTVPAGLCIYFIASSLWGIGERKMLDHMLKDMPSLVEREEKEGGKPRNSLWTRLLEQADTAAKQAHGQNAASATSPSDSNGSSGDGYRKDRRKSKNRR